ncbi:hypothetical protein KM043_015692 [Ampulex compressa]|nr:hypothetical protein KM043_015692 [Ampulex compressa]
MRLKRDRYIKTSKSYGCRLGPKTPYRFIANYDDSPLNYPACREKKIWLVMRHGTRYPGINYIRSIANNLLRVRDEILKNYADGKTELSSNDMILLENWKMTYGEEDAMKLAQEGEEEMIDLAERYQTRFPNLMPEIYKNETYKFKYTETQRTEESARHFAAGLFGWHNSQEVWYPQPEYKDSILRFYKRCSRWRAEVDKNPAARSEVELFLNTQLFAQTLGDISRRIGLQVDYETAVLIYIACAFETAWNRSVESPWCKLLSSSDFQVLEFAEDLDYYWIDGYGHRLTYEQACPALMDMFQFFEAEGGPSVVAYFTHSGTILKLLALLGVAKDEKPLTHESFFRGAEDRAWRISLIDAFASNIAFVQYECVSSGTSILFIHQERVVTLKGCPDNMPCPISVMKALYPDTREECDFDAMCNISRDTSS